MQAFSCSKTRKMSLQAAAARAAAPARAFRHQHLCCSLRKNYGAASNKCQLEKQHDPSSKNHAAGRTTAQPVGRSEQRHGTAWLCCLRLVVAGHCRVCCTQGALLECSTPCKLVWDYLKSQNCADWRAWPGGTWTAVAPVAAPKLAHVAAACPPPPNPSLTFLQCSRHRIISFCTSGVLILWVSVGP